MKLKYTFVVNTVADKKVAVVVGEGLENFNGFIKMDDIGAEIFEIFKNDTTIEDAVKIMLEKHPEATEQEATEAVTEFVAKLQEKGIIE